MVDATSSVRRRGRGSPSPTRLKPTRFAADATQLVRRVFTDGTGGNVIVLSLSFSALGAACCDEETVGDMKRGDLSFIACLPLSADDSGSFLLPLGIFVLVSPTVLMVTAAIDLKYSKITWTEAVLTASAMGYET